MTVVVDTEAISQVSEATSRVVQQAVEDVCARRDIDVAAQAVAQAVAQVGGAWG